MRTALSHFGDDSPLSLLSSVYNTVEFRSRLTPSLSFNVADVTGGSPGFMGPLLQPAVILTGPAGQQVIAPYGTPDPYTGWLAAFALFGGVFALGAVFGKRAARS